MVVRMGSGKDGKIVRKEGSGGGEGYVFFRF